MKCPSAVFFKEQDFIFIQVIISKVPSHIFFLWCLLKNELACWLMSINSLTVRYLLNAVVKVPRNCWQGTLNIADTSNFWNSAFEIIIITVTEIVASKQKKERKTRNAIAPSYNLKVSSAQNQGINLLKLLKFQISRLFQPRCYLTFTQPKCRFTLKRVCDMMRTLS